jgi:hypothetical protein
LALVVTEVKKKKRHFHPIEVGDKIEIIDGVKIYGYHKKQIKKLALLKFGRRCSTAIVQVDRRGFKYTFRIIRE